MMQEAGKSRMVSIVFAALILGVLLGNLLSKRNIEIHNNLRVGSILSSGKNGKVTEILNLIDRKYVDSVDVNKYTEELSSDLVSKLDPHSVYIPKEDTQESDEELNGSFSGIGVQFNIQNDTVMIIQVIPGGPSEKVGLQSGDRLVLVNDSNFTGKTINNRKVLKTLKGQKGTEVKVGVKRLGATEILDYTITRGDIPVKSVDIAYQIEPGTGVIKVNKFSKTTYSEFLNAIADLKAAGTKKFVIDLRQNSGGLMDQCISMVNEFLPKGQLIVYAKGKSYPRYDAISNGTGSCINEPVVVLIDEFSASASEIFSGAMQDNDRATVIGRRSFGKGLVQQPFQLSDSSELRLTIARYYTPSGRCIQKPYKKGDQESYAMDLVNRFKHGEFESADSISFTDTVQYKTLKGRTVYGGGGIMPDIFIPRDTTSFTPFFNEAVNKMMIYKFAFKYTDLHRDELSKFQDWKTLYKNLSKKNLLQEFVTYSADNKLKPGKGDLQKSGLEITSRLIYFIARNIQGDEAFYPIYYSTDEAMKKALDVLRKEQ